MHLNSRKTLTREIKVLELACILVIVIDKEVTKVKTSFLALPTLCI